jgi:prophage maintenance system killer protein
MNNEILELSKLIDLYTSGLDLLDDYDHQCVSKPQGSKSIYTIEYKEARHIIDSMKFSNASNVFGLEKEPGKLEGILAAINQYVFDKEVYKTIEEKAAYLLYFLIKDHPFVDGCKRIAATLFLEFLNRNNKLIRNGELIISNKTLVAITLLTAESLPDEMETIIRIIMHLLIN